MDEALATQIRALIEPILTERNMELVELVCRPAGRQYLVRVLVDTVGGVTIQQCARVNQLMSEALEAANLIEHSYTVEVSSPGLDRPLTSRRDFERAVGEQLAVEVANELGHSRAVQGMLLAVQPDAIVLKTSAGNLTLPLAEVRIAKKHIQW